MPYHPVKASSLPGYHSKPALVSYVLANDAVRIRELLASGIDVDAQRFGGLSALYWACTIPSDYPLQLLLAHGAQIDPTQEADDSPLLRVCHECDLKKMEMLLDAGADPNAKVSGHPLLTHLASAGHPNLTAVLIEHGADVHCVNIHGDQAIHLAARAGHAAVIGVLLVAGASVEAPSPHADGATPLAQAVKYNKVDAVRVLLEAGAIVTDAIADAIEQEPDVDALLDSRMDGSEYVDFLEVRRTVRAAILAQRLEAAMPGDTQPLLRSGGPSPL